MNKILFFTVGDYNHASSRTRAFNYVKGLKSNGFQSEVIYKKRVLASKFLSNVLNFNRKRLFVFFVIFKLILAQKGTMIVFQKEWISEIWVKYFKKKKKLLFIYDLDDAIFLKYNEKKYRAFKSFLSSIDLLIVSTKYLYREIKFVKSYRIIPTPVRLVNDQVNHFQKQVDNTIRFGWVGSPSTEDNLNIVLPIFEKLSKFYNFELLLLGVENPQKYKSYQWCKAKVWEYKMETEVLCHIDYGVAPLHENQWNMCKGGYKISLYMSHSKPVLTSSTGINKDMVRHRVTGFVCHNADDWELNLIDILSNRVNYLELAKNSQECFQSLYTVDVCLEKFVESIEYVRNH